MPKKEISLDDIIGDEKTKLTPPKNKKETKMSKQPKTIKVSTVVISVAVFLALIASFIGGMVTANQYRETVQAQALELSSKIEGKQ